MKLMKVSKTATILLMIFIISVIMGCYKNTPITASNTAENTTKMTFLHDSNNSNMDISNPSTVDNVENIMENTDARVLWIKENLSSLTCIEGDVYKDCYDGNNLVYRSFYQVPHSESLSSSADANEYILYYDEHGNLIYTDITHYRGPLYSIYIQNNTLFHVEVGPFSYKGGTFVNGNFADVENAIKEDVSFNFILEDLAICLENAH